MLLQRAQHYRWTREHHMVVAADAAIQRAVTALFSMSCGAEPVPALRDRVPTSTIHLRLGRRRRRARRRRSGRRLVAEGSMPVLVSMATEESPAGEQARATLALIRALDSMSITPIPAWRDYHGYVARIEQTRDVVAELVRFADPDDTPDFLASTASQQAVAALEADLPARLNAALHAVPQPYQTDAALEDAERWLTDAVPAFAGLGRRLLSRTSSVR